ncbi:MAG: ABC transporter ATP-binding protein [Propionibacteriales bacterium]|nr:ABC transporter ATP-binding protein [Propionibacteriales bacterium]
MSGSAGTLTVRDLTVRFDDGRRGTVVAVDAVDLDLPPGSVTAVLGPSGCGKSTLLRAIAGLERSDRGVIAYGGADLAGTPVHRRGFALMFQDGQLFPHADVAANIGYPLRLRRRRRAEVRARVGELLDLVGLDGYAARMPATLSGGERQRVALARALAVEPRLLLLDEPFSALDRGMRERLAAEVADILRRAGTTSLVVTHDHEEAFAVADRIAVMRAGELVQVGGLAEVWAAPVDASAAELLGYDTVVAGEGAALLGRLVGGDTGEADWDAVALRRSALVLDGSGPLAGVVRAARATPDLVRLELDVDGLGRVSGVADLGQVVAVGQHVRLGVRADRLAALESKN